MKKIISFIICVYLTTAVFSQRNFKNGVHIKHDSLKVLEGKWQSIQGLDTLIIILKLKQAHIRINDTCAFDEDFIVGLHEFKRGNKIIESSLNRPFLIDTLDIFNTQKFKINHPISISGKNDSIYSGSFVEITKNKYYNLEMKLSSNGNHLEWQLFNKEYVLFNTKIDYDFTVPSTLTLYRVN